MGIGKTEICPQVAEEAGADFHPIFAANEAAEDIAGLPNFNGPVLDYKMPYWWKQFENSKKGLILIDEPSRADQDIENALFALIEEGKRSLRGRSLSPNVMIVLSDNPDKRLLQSTSSRPSLPAEDALTLDVGFTFDGWYDYASSCDYDKALLSFAMVNKEMVWIAPESVKEGEVPANPAGYGTVNRWLKRGIIDSKKISQEDELLIASKIGSVAAATFVTFCRDEFDRFIQGDALMNDYESQLPSFLSQQEKGLNDKITASIESLVIYLDETLKSNEDQLPEKVKENLFKLIREDKLKPANRTLLFHNLISHDKLKNRIPAILVEDADIRKLMVAHAEKTKATK